MSRVPAAKRRRLSPPETGYEAHSHPQSDDSGAQPNLANDFSESAVKWNLEQDYEQRPRKQKQKKEPTRLPIKNAQGLLERAPEATVVEGQISEDDSAADEEEGEVCVSDAESENSFTAKLSHLPQWQRILHVKEELATLGGQIIEDPEENIGLLRTLAQITSSRDAVITRLGLATQLAVYRDIIPDYRIRPAAEEELKAKLSKDVKKLRNFEQAIVSGYQKYVKELARIARTPGGSSANNTRLSTVAVSCASKLINAVPHFNFRGDLLKILIDKLASRQLNQDFVISHDAVEKLFQSDEEGNASLDAVALLAKMIKARDFRVHERVLNLLLNLRLLTEFSKKGSTTRIDKADEDASTIGKTSKAKREFRTKKQRKLAKERKAISEEMKEADAVVSHEQRDHLQAETLKFVFGVYFRLLKARTPRLMGPVLEGLVKYAHLINQNFFGDLLEALKELIEEAEAHLNVDVEGQEDAEVEQVSNEDARNATRESLLCVITAFALLQGQDAAAAAPSLSLDLSFFISHLYRTLYPVAMYADIERSSKTSTPHDRQSSDYGDGFRGTAKVDVQRTIVLLLRSLHAVLLPMNARMVPPIRLAAFLKQILASSLQLPEKSCTAMLGLMIQIMKIHRRKVAALWQTEERRGDGVFDPLIRDVEGSNPFASTVWEGELLRLHYAPSVREGLKNLEAAVMED